MHKYLVIVFLICTEFVTGQDLMRFKIEVKHEVDTPQSIDLSGVPYNLTGTDLALYQENNKGEQQIAV
ncbi:MAG: hypothetical protein AAF361_02485, partial [Bacteroidota bacterium]